jgi:hypothetical protein
MDSLTDGSATSLNDFLADAFPGAMEDSGLEETPTDVASADAGGAPPPEPAAQSDGSQPQAEGENVADPAKTADVAAGAPDNTAQPNTPDLDLAKAVPLTYSVDKQARTFDDIKVIPGVGGVISADALPKLQQRLSERDALYERAQHSYQREQAFDALTRFEVRGADGKTTVLSGREGIEAQRVAHAQTTAALQTLGAALTDPRVFASLVTLDDTGNLALNRDALEHVMTRSENAEMRATQSVRAGLQSAYEAASAPPQDTPETFVQQAPVFAEHYAKEYGQNLLDDEDKAFLAGQLRGYLRPATVEDVQANPQLQVGQVVIDPAYEALAIRMAELKKSSASAATTATQAAQENERRLAGVIPGRARPTAPANGQRPPAPPPVAKQTNADDAFAMQERLLSGRW